MTPQPTTVFKWLRAHKGHHTCEKVVDVHNKIRRAKHKAYVHDKCAMEAKVYDVREYHETEAQKRREVFIPALQDKLNQLIQTP